MAEVRLEGVQKTFADGTTAIAGLDLRIEDGELAVLVGPSGCGKSTILRMIAGLERPSRGRVLIGERDVTALPPQERDVAMVFQSYALYPHKTVRANLAFPLRMKGEGREAIGRRVEEVAGLLGIERLLDRRPRQLSGGQRQRVALGRALVREPAAFLLDEPLSNLDPALRVSVRTEIARLHRRIGATMIHVTHDQEEALTLGRRVVVLRDGAIEQAAPPREVYRRPATEFVGRFVGNPAMNVIDVAVRDGRLRGPGGLDLAPPEGVALPAAGARLRLGIRPEDIALAPSGEGDLDAEVEVVQTIGDALVVHLRAAPDGADDAPAIVATVSADEEVREGARVALRARRDRLHVFAEDGRRL